MPYKIYHFKTLTSTNDKAKELLKKNKSNFVVVSEVQTKGRGRFGRKWYSSNGGLWLSITLKLKFLENIQYLTFLASIAVAKSIRKISKIKAMLKWPNDAYFNGKKLCGILTEGVFGTENHAVIGIGLDINQKNFPREIGNIATSLRIIRKKIFNRKIFLESILDEFEDLYGLYENKNFNEIILNWKKYSDSIGKKAKVVTKQKVYYGDITNVDDNCNLMLKLNNGKIVKIVEGDLFFKD